MHRTGLSSALIFSLALLSLGSCAPRTQMSGPFPADPPASFAPRPTSAATVIPVTPSAPPVPTNSVTYTCDGQHPLTVTYLGSSQAQVFWQGTVLALDQTESASGVRYTDGYYTWVTKGNQGYLTQPGLTQDSVIIANNCVAPAFGS